MASEQYNYGDDWPADLETCFKLCQKLALPFYKDGSPLVMLRQIEGAAMVRKPEKKASRTGVRNPNAKPKVEVLPADPSVKETENELLQRQEAQATCRFQIFPKSTQESKEAIELYLRRLNTHREAPDALVLPMQAGESATQYIARMFATTKSEATLCFVQPKASKEGEAEYESRLKAHEKTASPVIFPRSKHEKMEHFDIRLKAQIASSVPIMPKSENEPHDLFSKRCALQKNFAGGVIHPYDPSREDSKAYELRLEKQAAAEAGMLMPGDVKGETPIDLSPVAAAVPDKEAAADDDDDAESKAAAADPLRKEREMASRRLKRVVANALDHIEGRERAMSELTSAITEAGNVNVDTKAIEEAEGKLAELKLLYEKDLEEERAARKEAAAKEAVEREAAKAQEALDISEAKRAPEVIDISSVGFKALKDMLIERGVPADIVKSAPQKFALKEIAEKHPACGLTFQ